MEIIVDIIGFIILATIFFYIVAGIFSIFKSIYDFIVNLFSPDETVFGDENWNQNGQTKFNPKQKQTGQVSKKVFKPVARTGYNQAKVDTTRLEDKPSDTTFRGQKVEKEETIDWITGQIKDK